MAIREVLSDSKDAYGPFPASTAVAPSDLLWFDAGAGVLKPASARADQGSLVANQRDFADLFAGVSNDARLAAETSTGRDSWRTFATQALVDADCASGTWEFGDLIGIDRNSGVPANHNQQVAKVTNPALAIGVCVKREPTAVTKVRCVLTSRWVGGEALLRRRGLGGGQGTGSAALADADVTLTPGSAPILTGIPTTARKVILPPPALSAGLMFFVVNNSGGANALNVRDNADAATIQAVAQGKRAVFFCDGTTWFGLPGA